MKIVGVVLIFLFSPGVNSRAICSSIARSRLKQHVRDVFGTARMAPKGAMQIHGGQIR